MDELRRRLQRLCEWAGPPRADAPPELPAAYRDILAVADGFVTRRGGFRFFPWRTSNGLPGAEDWNRASWKAAYGALLAGLRIVAEDVFGDQYGFAADGRFVKAFCEGGRIESLPDLKDFLLERVLREPPTAFDVELADLAFDELALRPGPGEHLAFSLPLAAGGEAEPHNLAVESAAAHLEALGRLNAGREGAA